jgi:hypothetical protein
MEVESSSSLSSSSSSLPSYSPAAACSSSSSLHQSSLFSFLEHVSSSSASSSSSSQGYSASSDVEWIDRSKDKAWDSPVWQLGLFLCSSSKLSDFQNCYAVKCKACESHHVSFIKAYKGTKTFIDHAEKVHTKDQKVGSLGC